MSARTKAIAAWERESSLCFDREETLCLMHGIVIATPDLYLMAMPVWSQMTDQQIYDNAHLTCHPRQLSAWGPPDMLHILLAYGTYENLKRHFRTMPALQFPYVCYGRSRYFKRIRTTRFTDEKKSKATPPTATPSHGSERPTAAHRR